MRQIFNARALPYVNLCGALKLIFATLISELIDPQETICACETQYNLEDHQSEIDCTMRSLCSKLAPAPYRSRLRLWPNKSLRMRSSTSAASILSSNECRNEYKVCSSVSHNPFSRKNLLIVAERADSKFKCNG